MVMVSAVESSPIRQYTPIDSKQYCQIRKDNTRNGGRGNRRWMRAGGRGWMVGVHNHSPISPLLSSFIHRIGAWSLEQRKLANSLNSPTQHYTNTNNTTPSRKKKRKTKRNRQCRKRQLDYRGCKSGIRERIARPSHRQCESTA